MDSYCHNLYWDTTRWYTSSSKIKWKPSASTNLPYKAPNLTCSNKTSVALRGTNWQSFSWSYGLQTKATPGVTLTGDSTCAVQIQSLDDRSVKQCQTEEWYPAIFSVGCAGVLLIVIMSIGAVLSLRKGKSSKSHLRSHGKMVMHLKMWIL